MVKGQLCVYATQHDSLMPYLQYIPKYSYFCTPINYGPIVQWIEFQIPVLKIWVRIPMGSLLKNHL